MTFSVSRDVKDGPLPREKERGRMEGVGSIDSEGVSYLSDRVLPTLVNNSWMIHSPVYN